MAFEGGEKLCKAYELYWEWEPEAHLEFDYAVLLDTGAIKREEVELSTCANCGCALLLDKLNISQLRCARCRNKYHKAIQRRRRVPIIAINFDLSACDGIAHSRQGRQEQRALQLPMPRCLNSQRAGVDGFICLYHDQADGLEPELRLLLPRRDARCPLPTCAAGVADHD